MRDDKILDVNIEKLIKIVEESYSFVEVGDKLNINKGTSKFYRLERYIRKLNINYEHFNKTAEQSKSRWCEENIKRCIVESKTYKDILEKLDILPTSSAYERLKNYLKKYNIEFKTDLTTYKWGKENLERIINESLSYKECLINMKLRAAGDNYKVLKKYIKKYNLSIIHFVDKKNKIKRTLTLEDILVENSSYKRTSLKERLYKEGLKERKCELCGQDEEWNGKQMSLILDHINGVYNDNRFENLRIVCPNCNATLETHCGKNRKVIKKEKIKHFCECGNEIHIKSEKCLKCTSLSNRTVERPTYEFLLKEIKETNYCAVGRKYGVSDNAIRKWVKQYEK